MLHLEGNWLQKNVSSMLYFIFKKKFKILFYVFYVAKRMSSLQLRTSQESNGTIKEFLLVFFPLHYLHIPVKNKLFNK